MPLDSDPPELGAQLNALRVTLYSNSALLQNKTGQFGDAADNATKALETEGIADKDKAKAYFRRAQARVAKKNEEEALVDLEEAGKLAPGDAAIVKELESIKKKIKERKEREKKAYKNAFNF